MAAGGRLKFSACARATIASEFHTSKNIRKMSVKSSSAPPKEGAERLDASNTSAVPLIFTFLVVLTACNILQHA